MRIPRAHCPNGTQKAEERTKACAQQHHVDQEAQQGCQYDETGINEIVMRLQTVASHPQTYQRLANQHQAVREDHFLKKRELQTPRLLQTKTGNTGHICDSLPAEENAPPCTYTIGLVPHTVKPGRLHDSLHRSCTWTSSVCFRDSKPSACASMLISQGPAMYN